MKLLFIGDVVGEAGCKYLRSKLYGIKKDHGIDITIVNGENSATGNGITRESCDELTSMGVDVITTGNHCFRRFGSEELFESVDHLLRPVNYPEGVPGKGVYILDMGRCRVAIVNLMGVVYMEPLENPFSAIDRVLEIIDTKNIIVDLHAEASAEKKALGYYLQGRVSAVLGTHTHVQTADEQLIGGTAYITDVGFTGPEESVLGIDKDKAIFKQKMNMPTRFEEADTKCFINGVVVDLDEKTGKARSIERLVIRD